MPRPAQKTPIRDLKTYGRTHAVRIADFDYTGNVDIHLVLCAFEGSPFDNTETAASVCESIEFYCDKLGYRLYGYCLMPDHLHALLSPADSGRPLRDWLRDFKSYTTNRYRKKTGKRRLWQESGYDHVCRTEETAERILTYIVNNTVRAGLVERWMDWPWTKVFIDI
jgi:putative transposase